MNTTGIDNKYEIYYRTCADGSSTIEGFDFNISHAPVSGIQSLHIIIAISPAEGLIIFVLDISNVFQNTILSNRE